MQTSPFTTFHALIEDYEGETLVFSEPIWIVVETATILSSDQPCLILVDWTFSDNVSYNNPDYVESLIEDWLDTNEENLSTVVGAKEKDFTDFVDFEENQ